MLMALPKRSTVTRSLQRHRLKLNVIRQGGITLPPLPLSHNFDVPDVFKDMVVFDSGTGDSRVIILGCDVLLDALARADVWLADGTCSVVPNLFYQLYSIHFQFGSGLNPAAIYCLLTDKTGASYTIMLNALKELIPWAKPSKVLADFERAAMSVFQLAYPTALILVRD